MAERIEYKDIISEDVITNIGLLIKEFEKLSNTVKELSSKKINFNVAGSGDSDMFKKQAEQIEKLQEQIDKLTKAKKEQADQERETSAAAKAAADIIKEQMKLGAAMSKEIEKQNELEKENIRLTTTEIKTISDLAKQTSVLIKQRKELDIANGNNAKQFEELTRKIASNQIRLKEYDKEIGNYQRNVGNYEKALQGLFGDRASQRIVGIATGINQVAGAFGAAGQVIGAVVDVYNKLDATVKDVNAVENIMRNTFALTGDQLKENTIVVRQLSEFYGKDYTEIITRADELSKKFSITASEALRLVSEELQKGSDTITEYGKSTKRLSDAWTEFTTQVGASEGILEGVTSWFKRQIAIQLEWINSLFDINFDSAIEAENKGIEAMRLKREKDFKDRKAKEQKEIEDKKITDKANREVSLKAEEDYLKERNSIRDKYGITTQQEYYERELVLLKSALRKKIITQEEFEQEQIELYKKYHTANIVSVPTSKQIGQTSNRIPDIVNNQVPVIPNEKVKDIQEGFMNSLNIDPKDQEKLRKDWSELGSFISGQLNNIMSAQIQATDTQIEQSDNRLSQLQKDLDEQNKLKEQGIANNAENIKKEIEQEKKKKEELEAQRKKEVNRLKGFQKAQATIQYGIELANIALAASQNPLNGYTFAAAGAIQYAIQAAIATTRYIANLASINSAKYAVGTEYVDSENRFPSGTDTVNAKLTKGERVLTVEQNKALGNIKNSEIPLLVKAGSMLLKQNIIDRTSNISGSDDHLKEQKETNKLLRKWKFNESKIVVDLSGNRIIKV